MINPERGRKTRKLDGYNTDITLHIPLLQNRVPGKEINFTEYSRNQFFPNSYTSQCQKQTRSGH